MSSTVTLKDEGGNNLYPKTIGSAVTVYRGGESSGSPITLQAIVDQLPNFSPSSTGSVAGKSNVTLSLSPTAVITIDGYDNGGVALPDSFTVPSGWVLGGISGDGKIGSSYSIQNGNCLVVCNNLNEVKRADLSFDTSDQYKYLRHDGTWQEVSTMNPKWSTGQAEIVRKNDETITIITDPSAGRTYSTITLAAESKAPTVSFYLEFYSGAGPIDHRILIYNTSDASGVLVPTKISVGTPTDYILCSSILAPSDSIYLDPYESKVINIDIFIDPSSAKAEQYIAVITQSGFVR